MSRASDAVTTGILVLSAVAVAAAAVHREFGTAQYARGAVPSKPPAYLKDWQQYTKYAKWIGDSNATVRIVEFADFECPFCRRFQETFAAARDSLKGSISLAFVEFPLSIHRFAKPAAYAAECADRQQRWEQFHTQLFAQQDSFGLKSWGWYANRAGIADTLSFNRCVQAMTFAPSVDSAMAQGKRLGLRGTPTVIINGWQYSIPPYDSLTPMIREMLAHATKTP
jgi:protein-disulfide isomerase